MSSTITPWWVDFIAGWCSGAVSLLICQPLDTILTRQQATANNNSKMMIHPTTLIGVSSSTAAPVNHSTAALVAASSSSLTPNSSSSWIPKSTHFISLWRGVAPMIGAVPIQNALLMSGYGFCKRWSTTNEINDNDGTFLLYWGIFIGGCTGGILQSFLMSPIELLKVTQQVYRQNVSLAFTTIQQQQHHMNSTGISHLSTTTVSNRIKHRLWNSPFWKGLYATLWRDGIPHGVWFVSYEYLKNYLDQQYLHDLDINSTINNNHNNTNATYIFLYHSMISGAFAATCAWLVGVRLYLNSLSFSRPCEIMPLQQCM